LGSDPINREKLRANVDDPVVATKKYKSGSKLSSQVIWTGKQSSSKFTKKKILAGTYKVKVSWVDSEGNEGALEAPLTFQVKK